MLKWSIQQLRLDLKFNWKISRGSSQQKSIFHICVEDGDFLAKGEVAGITTSENEEDKLFSAFQEFAKNFDSFSLQSIQHLPPHLRFGIESAWTHLCAKKNNQKVSEYLNLSSPQEFKTSFSLPILPPHEIESFFNQYDLKRFPYLKIKVGFDNQVECCTELARHYSGPIRVDANEAFQSAHDVISFYDQVSHLNIEFLEQPIPRARLDEYKKLKNQLPCPILADESLQDQDVPSDFHEYFDGINVKLMKAGSYQQAIKQLKQARNQGLKTMLGCMVETSLGISCALQIADGVDYLDLDGFLFFQEPPYNFVSERNGILKNIFNNNF